MTVVAFHPHKQMYERPHHRSPASGDLSRLPVIRYWGGDSGGLPQGMTRGAGSEGTVPRGVQPRVSSILHTPRTWRFTVQPLGGAGTTQGGGGVKLSGPPQSPEGEGRSMSAWEWEPQAERCGGSECCEGSQVPSVQQINPVLAAWSLVVADDTPNGL